MRTTLISVLCATALLSACASGSIKPYATEPAVARDIVALYGRLDKAVAAQSFIQVKTLGEVAYGNYKAPVELYSVYNTSGYKYRVFLSGGIHGNEPAGAETVARFIESLARSSSTFSSIAFDIVPITNPWGWSHDVRYNQAGKDINRDFASFATQEAAIISSYLQGKRYDLIIDDHEDPGGKGFYIYQYAVPDQVLARKVISAIREMGFPIEQDVNMVILKTNDGLIDAPMWGLCYMKATGQLSFPNYCRLFNSDRVYTVETPTALPFEERVKIHDKAREMILQDLLSK